MQSLVLSIMVKLNDKTVTLLWPWGQVTHRTAIFTWHSLWLWIFSGDAVITDMLCECIFNSLQSVWNNVMIVLQPITEVLSQHEMQSELFMSSGVARGYMESYKASKLSGVVLADCGGRRQPNFMKSHLCCLFKEPLEWTMLRKPRLCHGMS